MGLTTAVILAGCSRSEGPAKTGGAPVPVLATAAVEKTIPTQIQAIGNVTPISKVTVRSQITGKLETVNFKEGQPVKRGDLLFTIDPRPSQAALDRRGRIWRGTRPNWRTQKSSSTANRNCSIKNRFPGRVRHEPGGLDALVGTVAADKAAITNARVEPGIIATSVRRWTA